jgi:CRP-like cAMP-binding protein
VPENTGLLESVSRLQLFGDLDAAELSSILETLKEVVYDEGQWVVRRGESNPGLQIIVDGEAGVVLESEELATLKKGSFFGEISALLEEPTVADVVARARLRCLLVPSEDVERFLLANPRVMYRMLQTEARRVRTTDERRL